MNGIVHSVRVGEYLLNILTSEAWRKTSMSAFDQEIKWRVPSTTAKWKGKAEIVMSVATPKGRGKPAIDIRTRRTIEHPKGEGFTREGVRLSLEDTSTLIKALTHTLEELRETDDSDK
jgi:hypothetical protein